MYFVGIVYYLEAVYGPVVRVEHEGGEGACLRGPVPAVRAVHYHTDAL